MRAKEGGRSQGLEYGGGEASDIGIVGRWAMFLCLGSWPYAISLLINTSLLSNLRLTPSVRKTPP
jgi:hypothetical protein